jgi:hypothetical protein
MNKTKPDFVDREMKKLPAKRQNKIKRVARRMVAAHSKKKPTRRQARDIYKEFLKAYPAVRNHLDLAGSFPQIPSYILRAKADVIVALDGRSKPGRVRFFCYPAYKIPGEPLSSMPGVARSFDSKKEALAHAKEHLEMLQKSVLRQLKAAMETITQKAQQDDAAVEALDNT